mgnify:CR=1 FL=1
MVKNIWQILKKVFLKFRRQDFWIQLLIVFIVFGLLQVLGQSCGIVEGLTNNNDNNKVLTYFHMNNCPHCVKFSKDVWDDFVDEDVKPPELKKKKKLLKKAGLSWPPKAVEVAEQTDEHKKLDLEGYPTIMILNSDGTAIEGCDKCTWASEQRTKENLEQFIKDFQSKSSN